MLIIALVAVIQPSEHLNKQGLVSSKPTSIVQTVGLASNKTDPQAKTIIQTPLSPVQNVAPVVPAVQAAVTYPSSCSDYVGMLSQYNWNVNIMAAIMRAESGCDPYAVNTHNYDGVYDYGLLQLHGQDIINPAQNIAAAYRIWSEQGYGAWSSYNSGVYVSFLN